MTGLFFGPTITNKWSEVLRRRLYVVGLLVLLLGTSFGVAAGAVAHGSEPFSGSGYEGPIPSVPPHPGADTPPQPRHHAPVFTSQDPSTLLPGRLIVQLKDGVDFHALDTDVQQLHGRDNNPAMPELTVRVIEVPVGTEQAAISALKNNPNIEDVHQDHFLRPACHEGCGWYPNDTDFACNSNVCDEYWALNAGQTISGGVGLVDADSDLPEAWAGGLGIYQNGSGQWVSPIIAILDTGIQADHPDLNGKVTYEQNFHTPGDNANDYNGHGTAVAGVAAAKTNNSYGIAGACPDCKIWNLKVSDNSTTSPTISYGAVACAIEYASVHGAQIINMSFTGTQNDATAALKSDQAASRGTYQVAPTGNGNTRGVTHYPAAWTYVEAVAGSNNYDVPYWKSSSDGSNDGGDIVAAAQDMRILWKGSVKTIGSGTSYAAPLTAGIAGLLVGPCQGQWPLSCIGNALDNHAESISSLAVLTNGGTGRRVNARCAVLLPANCVPSR